MGHNDNNKHNFKSNLSIISKQKWFDFRIKAFELLNLLRQNELSAFREEYLHALTSYKCCICQEMEYYNETIDTFKHITDVKLSEI